jgi:hypothetical protein
MRSRAFALAPLVFGCVFGACGGQKTTSTTPVASASASASTPVVVQQQSSDAGVAQIDPAAVRNVIRGATARFMICYVAGLKKDKKLAGRVETKFVIDETGHVISAEDVTKSNVLQDDATRDCIVSKFKQLEFPPPQPSGKVPITYPLLLDPSMVTVETPDAGAPNEPTVIVVEHRYFNAASAAGALGKIDVNACRNAGGFHGAGHIKVTFESAGTVSKAEIDAPANVASTAAGACVVKAFMAAHVTTYEGSSVTVGKSFNVP